MATLHARGCRGAAQRVWSALALLFLAGFASYAQTPPPPFETASIKANHSGDRIMLFHAARGGRFTAANCSLRLLIQYAFDVYQFQIEGAPGWVATDRYDIAAKSEGDPQVREIRAMVRRPLEDRFGLRTHWETKEAGVYDLVVSKPGKLREAAPGECPAPLSEPASPTGTPPDVPCGTLLNSPGNTGGRKLTAADLSDSLGMFVGRPVVDKTGLHGKYDIHLTWTPEPARLQSSAPAQSAETDSTGPSIFRALQEQAGLKLESARGAVRTLVVDRVEKPSGN